MADIWWCLDLLARAGLPPLLLALLLSAVLRRARRSEAPAPRDVVWATFALGAYLIACAWWWHYSYPDFNETGGWPTRFHNLLARWGAAIGIAWGLFRLIASNWSVLRTPDPRGFEVIGRSLKALDEPAPCEAGCPRLRPAPAPRSASV